MNAYERNRAVALVLSSSAVEEYETRGLVAPAVVALGRTGLMATIPTDRDPLISIPTLAHWLAWAARARHVAWVAECWSREWPDDGVDHPRPVDTVETDPFVTTSISVQVLDTTEPGSDVIVLSRLHLDDQGMVGWTTDVVDRSIDNDLALRIREALACPPPWPPPGRDHIDEFLQRLIDQGQATAAMKVPA
jgi:hypothetical protein